MADLGDNNPLGPSLAEDLLSHCRQLLSELDQYREFLVERQQDDTVIRSFRNTVQTELNTLEKVSSGDLQADRTVHTLRSSNFPFYATVWEAAKRCNGLVSFSRRFYWDVDHLKASSSAAAKETPKNGKRKGDKSKQKSILVDIVAEDGTEWVKVSTISESRLLMDMTKAGWEWDGPSEDDAEDEDLRRRLDKDEESEDEELQVELITLAKHMKKAANAVRIRYQHPRVKLLLPKIKEGKISHIDDLLQKIRDLGVTVECGEPPTSSLPTNGNSTTTTTQEDFQTSSLIETFQHLVVDEYKNFTPTLNIDCTLLLAIVSDLSHYPITPSSHYHKAIRRQIELEATQAPLVPSKLWPAMGTRNLLCTAPAHTRFSEIVDLIGTPTEKKRAAILMGEGTYEGCSREELITAFQSLTSYPVPLGWVLPIKIFASPSSPAPSSLNLLLSQLPPIATKVSNNLTPINQSIFLFGWHSGLTTLSSNKTVARQIENIIEEGNRNEDGGGDKEGVRGPDIWVCGTARSLLAKDKERRE
ncbi:MAG: hypothetical protein M1834_000487 [Cirrosporium novae-zelandiae]|nr:MAG: hypothetical protein M1834_000487 [Cirrosporium novae-zelandiae]